MGTPDGQPVCNRNKKTVNKICTHSTYNQPHNANSYNNYLSLRNTSNMRENSSKHSIHGLKA